MLHIQAFFITESICMSDFINETQIVEFGSRTFLGNFEASNFVFGGKNFLLKCGTLWHCSTFKCISNDVRIKSIRYFMQNLCRLEFYLSCLITMFKRMSCQPLSLMGNGISTWMQWKISTRIKYLNLVERWRRQTWHLVGYRAML